MKIKCSSGISIIICCYNSVERLPTTLQYIASQQVAKHIPWEVIVVNNASTDTTRQVAQEVWDASKCNTSFQIVDQSIPGLSNAREKGIETAMYEYLLFCDDDNWLDQNYVQIAYEIMEKNSRIGALGGLGIAECEVEPPSWFHDYATDYATGKQALQSGDITNSRKFVYGSGAIYRKSVLDKLLQEGFKQFASDRKGNTLSSGGDAEICYALILAGYIIWYDSRLVFRHYIPKERLTLDYIKKIHKGFGYCTALLMPYSLKVKGQKKKLKYQWYWLLAMGVILLIRSAFKESMQIKNTFSLLNQTNRIRNVHYLYGFIKYRKAIQELSQTLNGNAMWIDNNQR